MKKRKIRSTMSVFLTTFLLLQIILLFLYKSFIVDIAKKNEKNLVEKIHCKFIIIRWKVYWSDLTITWIFYWDVGCF